MKQQKLYRPRIPWYTWDYGYNLPPYKGINKILGNRKARRKGDRELKEEMRVCLKKLMEDK